MSLFPVPVTVLRDLEGVQARFFCGADIGEKKLHWVSWSRVMASRLEGGLGVGSLFSLNRAMLFKWLWRFFHNPNALWVSVIRVLHGHSGRLRDLPTLGAHYGPWKGIITAISDSIFQSISGKGYRSFGHALFKSLKSMHILQLPSTFLTIIGLEAHVGYRTRLTIPVLSHSLTSSITTFLLSRQDSSSFVPLVQCGDRCLSYAPL
ncbi:hypothetical protein Tco_0576597 [Tanacetum coccineum]